MTFNKDSRLDSSRVRRSSGGHGVRNTAAIGGGGMILLFILSQVFNVDLAGLLPGVSDPGTTNSQSQSLDLSHCQSGADANELVECRMVGAYNSLDDFWEQMYPQVLGEGYESPGMEVFTGSVSTACGASSSAMGPFYCPGDNSIYLDTDFFESMTTQLGAEGGPLAEMYVVAHEWGHHVQNISAIMQQANRQGSGPTSDSVRLELQADCLAGMWAAGATTTKDASGRTFLEPVTQEQWRQALDAAASVGDDHIQAQSGTSAHPESWTHGSSDQRMRWLTTGSQWYATGLQGQSCDTFAVSGDQL